MLSRVVEALERPAKRAPRPVGPEAREAAVAAVLYGLEQVLMPPSCNSPLWPVVALRFERTSLTGGGPLVSRVTSSQS